MKPSLFYLFRKYVSVGVLNTGLHWTVFFILVWFIKLNTAWANLLAFFVAVTFSFFANAAYTFQTSATKKKYILFTVFMAALSFALGWVSDALHLQPLIALISFSLLSLVLGFLYSRYIIFKNID